MNCPISLGYKVHSTEADSLGNSSFLHMHRNIGHIKNWLSQNTWFVDHRNCALVIVEVSLA